MKIGQTQVEDYNNERITTMILELFNSTISTAESILWNKLSR
jgi:hypothetical protein